MAAVLGLPPYLQFFDSNGDPLSGGKIYTYAAGTTTPKATYTTAAGNIEADNPIDLDASGIPDTANGSMWLIGSYKFVVKDALGNTIRTTDNVTSFSTLAEEAEAFFQSFSGNGSQTAFTLSESLGTEEKALMVFVSRELPSAVTNGTFDTDTGWNKGAGWTIGGGVATATGAISTAISQTSPITLVQGQAYSVVWTVTRSAGSIVCNIGGFDGVSRSASGTYNEVIICNDTQVISFTGSGFTGTIDNVKINPVLNIGFDILSPTAFTVNGTSLTFATAPATGTNNIYVFAPSLLLGAASSAAAAAEASATAALASEVAAAASASSASAFSETNLKWTYDSSTTIADPGTGELRLNNATLASVTEIAISETNADAVGMASYLAALDDSDHNPSSILRIIKNATNFAIYGVTGLTDNGGWDTLAVSYIGGAGSFTNGDSLYLGYAVSGDDTPLTFDGSDNITSLVSILRANAEMVTMENSGSAGGKWQFKVGGGGFEDGKFMIFDRTGGGDLLRFSINGAGAIVGGTYNANTIGAGATSGTNTGDNAINTQYSGLAASKQDTLISGTNIKTINSATILGSGDIAVATTAQGALADTALQAAAIGVSVQGYSAVLAATTASFLTADETKLDGIESGADVTDSTNVLAALVGQPIEATSINFGGNALSSYVEGTFTPTLVSSGGGTPTYTDQIGTYTRIGRVVFFQIRLRLATAGTLAAGNITIAGLPVTSGSVTFSTAVVDPTNLAATAITQINASIAASSTSIALSKYSAGSKSALTFTDITGTAIFNISGQYQV